MVKKMKKAKRTRRCYHCNQAIYFDVADKTDSGRFIPHNEGDGARHDCPKSHYRLKKKKKESDIK